MLTTRPEPRVAEVPERFAGYVSTVKETELMIWETDVFDALVKGSDPDTIIEKSIQVGWDPEFVKWLVYFTDAQKRPIRVVTPAEKKQIEYANRPRLPELVLIACTICTLVYGFSGPDSAISYVVARIIISPLAVLGQFIVIGSSEFAFSERALSLGTVILFLAVVYGFVWSIRNIGWRR